MDFIKVFIFIANVRCSILYYYYASFFIDSTRRVILRIKEMRISDFVLLIDMLDIKFIMYLIDIFNILFKLQKLNF